MGDESKMDPSTGVEHGTADVEPRDLMRTTSITYNVDYIIEEWPTHARGCLSERLFNHVRDRIYARPSTLPT